MEHLEIIGSSEESDDPIIVQSCLLLQEIDYNETHDQLKLIRKYFGM